MSDIEYHNGDNEYDATTNRYKEVTAAAPKVERQLLMWPKVIEEKDGNLVTVGNRGNKELANEPDTPQNRERWRRYCEEALQPLVGSNEIRDVVVTVDDPAGARGVALDGVATKVEFFDIVAGRRDTVSAIPPWARA